MDKEKLDFLFTSSLERAFVNGKSPNIKDDEIIRFQPKYEVNRIALYRNIIDIVTNYMLFVDALGIKEEFIANLETGVEVTVKSLKTLSVKSDLDRRLISILNLVLYCTIRDTTDALKRINEDFNGLLKNTAYRVELYKPEDYIENGYLVQNHIPIKISFDESLIENKFDNKLLNSEIVYSTLKKDIRRDYRYIPLNYLDLGRALTVPYILVDEPLI